MEEVPPENPAAEKLLTPALAPAMKTLAERFAKLESFTKESTEAMFKALVEELQMKMGQLAQPVRVALTGRTASPGLFDVIALLGRDRTLARLNRAVTRAEAAASS